MCLRAVQCSIVHMTVSNGDCHHGPSPMETCQGGRIQDQCLNGSTVFHWWSLYVPNLVVDPGNTDINECLRQKRGNTAENLALHCEDIPSEQRGERLERLYKTKQK